MQDGWSEGTSGTHDPITFARIERLLASTGDGEGEKKKVRFEDGGAPTETIQSLLKRKKEEVEQRVREEADKNAHAVLYDTGKKRKREERFGHVTLDGGGAAAGTDTMLKTDMLHKRLMKFGTLPEETKGRAELIHSMETAKRDERARRLGELPPEVASIPLDGKKRKKEEAAAAATPPPETTKQDTIGATTRQRKKAKKTPNPVAAANPQQSALEGVISHEYEGSEWEENEGGEGRPGPAKKRRRSRNRKRAHVALEKMQGDSKQPTRLPSW